LCAGDEIVIIAGLPANVTLVLQGEQLSDNEVNAAQSLLRAAYPELGGLQDTILGKDSLKVTDICCVSRFNVAGALKDGYKFQTRTGPQILHVGKNHWCTNILTVGPSGHGVMLNADSMNPRRGVHRDVATLTKQLWPQGSASKLQVQQQEGGTDCGLFAIAFAVAWAFGEDLGRRFDQKSMRNHLAKCFRVGHITSFP
jgi:hypothetical protein